MTLPADIQDRLFEEFDLPADADSETLAQAVDDALFDEDERVHDELMQLETQLFLSKDKDTELLAQRAELTERQRLLQRALDYLDATECAVERIDDPTLAFHGRLVAEVSSRRGKVPRWTELRLYRTQDDGRYVCESVGVTTFKNEDYRRKVAVVDDEAGVTEFFGMGPLSQSLYDEAGFIVFETI